MSGSSNKDLAALLYHSLSALRDAVDRDQTGCFPLLAKGEFMIATTTQMQSLDIIAKDMSPKNKIKRFLKDMPSFLSEGRWATGNQNATIALALAGVETAYNNLKERYRALSGNEFVPDPIEGQTQAAQPQHVAANHQNSAYPRSSIQSQESDIRFRRPSDDSDMY
ncbi:hypothetical protein CPB85DRAFT_285679 [Mucidula mucida]|nr:hypothetical protein CPB85DRAFT_285679 [Mucidula mucida]